tara:strand:+ start:1392 stop:2114 length:723 start_codon:yes stop_codon:yes gene_type:complete
MIVELFGIPLSGKTTKKKLIRKDNHYSYKKFYIFNLYKKNKINFLTLKLLYFCCRKIEFQENILTNDSFFKKKYYKILNKILSQVITPYINKDYDLIKNRYSNFLFYFNKMNKHNTYERKKILNNWIKSYLVFYSKANTQKRYIIFDDEGLVQRTLSLIFYLNNFDKADLKKVLKFLPKPNKLYSLNIEKKIFILRANKIIDKKKKSFFIKNYKNFHNKYDIIKKYIKLNFKNIKIYANN